MSNKQNQSASDAASTIFPGGDTEAENTLLYRQQNGSANYGRFAVHVYRVLRGLRGAPIDDAYVVAVHMADALFGFAHDVLEGLGDGSEVGSPAGHGCDCAANPARCCASGAGFDASAVTFSISEDGGSLELRNGAGGEMDGDGDDATDIDIAATDGSDGTSGHTPNTNANHGGQPHPAGPNSNPANPNNPARVALCNCDQCRAERAAGGGSNTGLLPLLANTACDLARIQVMMVAREADGSIGKAMPDSREVASYAMDCVKRIGREIVSMSEKGI